MKTKSSNKFSSLFAKNAKNSCNLKTFKYFKCIAGLAQLVEQRIRNAWVGSSSLLTGTIKKLPLWEFFCGYLFLIPQNAENGVNNRYFFDDVYK